jgi:hypothetical protein
MTALCLSAQALATSDLTISSRLDMDGNANTRGPDDLVGRGQLKRSKQTAAASVCDFELKGRGFGGKFVTTKK